MPSWAAISLSSQPFTAPEVFIAFAWLPGFPSVDFTEHLLWPVAEVFRPPLVRIPRSPRRDGSPLGEPQDANPPREGGPRKNGPWAVVPSLTRPSVQTPLVFPTSQESSESHYANIFDTLHSCGQRSFSTSFRGFLPSPTFRFVRLACQPRSGWSQESSGVPTCEHGVCLAVWHQGRGIPPRHSILAGHFVAPNYRAWPSRNCVRVPCRARRSG
jgi:hypothetical protein